MACDPHSKHRIFVRPSVRGGPYTQPSPCWPGTVARALTEPCFGAIGEELALREVKGPIAQCGIEMVDFGADDISLITPRGRATKPSEKRPPIKAGFSGIYTIGEATVDDIL